MHVFEVILVSVLTWIEAAMNIPLYSSKGVVVTTLGGVLVALLLGAVAVMIGAVLRRWLIVPALRRTNLSNSMQYTMSHLGGYGCTALLLLIVLQNVGIDLSSFAFLAGTLFIGIGFGLQNIVSNFVSGLIILIEQPIKIGDRIDFGNLAGIVLKISARSTIIRTNDNIDVIVPNSDLVTHRVINWSYGEPEVRFRIPVGVAYGTDPDWVRECLLEVATAENHVLSQPPPEVFLESFGDNSLNFELVVWNRDMSTRPRAFRSLINYSIAKKLKERGIEIPFPQRDLHLRNETITVRMDPPSPLNESKTKI